VTLAGQPPSGVAFDLLASVSAAPAPDHVEGLALSRLTFACGQESAKTSGTEQLFFVEWGRVEVRDWTTDEVVAELTAGDAYGGDPRPVYLLTNQGKQASVLDFQASGLDPAQAKAPVFKDASRKTTDCESGAERMVAVTPATTTNLVVQPSLKTSAAPAADRTLFVGVLTVQPGAEVGDNEHPNLKSTGPLIVVPLLGSFGDGQRLMGLGPGPFGPGEPAVLAGGADQYVVLENAGSFPVTALLVGAIPAGEPVVAPARA
jgi:hypothetical protein